MSSKIYLIQYEKEKIQQKNIEGISGWQYNEDNNCFDYVGITNDDAYRGFSNTDIFNNDKYDYLKKDYESKKLEDDTNALINLLDTDIKWLYFLMKPHSRITNIRLLHFRVLLYPLSS